jgi:hypothetical protein
MAYVAPVTTVASVLPSFGSPSWPPFQQLNITVAAGTTTSTTIPGSGTLTFNNAAVTMSKGMVRVRLSNNGAAATVAVLVTATDGTLITVIAQTAVSASTTNVYDFLFPFMTELLLNKFTIAVTTVGAGGTFTGDYEVAGNP